LCCGTPEALHESSSGGESAGATPTRGDAGYGVHSRIHTAGLVDLATDLPLVLERADTDEHVAALLPGLTAMLDGGTVTTDPVDIRRHMPHTDREGGSPSA